MSWATTRRRGALRSAAAGALLGVGVAAAGVVALAPYELATGGAFYAERGGGSLALVAQFVLHMAPLGGAVAVVLALVGAGVGGAVGGRRAP